ncbi:Hypothetical protein SRAE_1000264000 [Strongyloides ratti]|uniref:Uncharacterized protein n=1 Tax=Strongyloides ratti TaxID=34506 RepID=A0A090L3K0_STRRB|nr:Hypothetical protein SRAE_1000264000 [Strongyloides ratti]CEF64386.1 Hypothetical protein SRAE_1000264000 [Strongyloides ratti]
MLKEKIYQKDLGNCTKFLENLQNDNNTNFEEYNYQSVIIKIKNSDKLKIGLYYEAIKRYKKNSGCEEWIKFEESIGEYLCISIIYITTAIQTWNMGWNVKKYKNEINLT